jgi:hypothetical protein
MISDKETNVLTVHTDLLLSGGPWDWLLCKLGSGLSTGMYSSMGVCVCADSCVPGRLSFDMLAS